MEGTLNFVIEKDITFGVLKIVWYLTFRDFISLTFASLLAEHPECLVSPGQPPGLRFWEQEAGIECSAILPFGVSPATKVTKNWLPK